MIDAERRLLANALKDPDNQHFILLSDRYDLVFSVITLLIFLFNICSLKHSCFVTRTSDVFIYFYFCIAVVYHCIRSTMCIII